jgi:hypothetical protein
MVIVLLDPEIPKSFQNEDCGEADQHTSLISGMVRNGLHVYRLSGQYTQTIRKIDYGKKHIVFVTYLLFNPV